MNNPVYQKISSPQNNQIKILEKLNTKKYRQKLERFTVENLAIIYDAQRAGYDFESLFVTEEFVNSHRDKLEYLEKQTQSNNFYLISSKINKHYSSLDTSSGITAVYKIKTSKLDNSSVIYLNGINDPGNLGTIMRSALAFNFVNLVLDKNCVDIYNPKVISAAKDAIFKLNIIEDQNGAWLANNKLPIYTTAVNQGLALGEFKPTPIFCLVLGSESHGISPTIMKQAQMSLKIKISNKIESLNVAMAASIIFYELSQK